jgi:hypothetical protein
VKPATTLVLVLLAPLFLVACGGDDDDAGDGTFDREEFPFTFSYPDGFEETDDVTIDQALGAQADETVGVMLDEQNGIFVQSFTLNIAVDESNIDLAKDEIDRLLQAAGPGIETEVTEVAGLPALEVPEFDVPTQEGARTRLIAIFDEEQEYYLNCQWTPAEEDAVTAACDEAVDTFALK